jgi:hypothetical protein
VQACASASAGAPNDTTSAKRATYRMRASATTSVPKGHGAENRAFYDLDGAGTSNSDLSQTKSSLL